MKPLTDLEATALGHVRRVGGCTAYALRQCFRASPSARFSDSAGSVYPMVERLARRRLLAREAVRQGKRDATVYRCTDAGLDALRAWVAVPDAPGELVTSDPLRTRVLSLGMLPPRERKAWVDAAQSALDEHRAHLRRLLRETDDPWLRLAHRNALLQASARLKWIAEVREAL